MIDPFDDGPFFDESPVGCLALTGLFLYWLSYMTVAAHAARRG